MKCTKCTEEAGTGRFCRSCGASTGAAVSPAMVCPTCGAEAHPGAKFCATCAAPLGSAASPPQAGTAHVICVNCGAENKSETKFCRSCGKAVSSGAPAVVSGAGLTPDMMPTMMTASRPVAVSSPPPPSASAMAEPVRKPLSVVAQQPVTPPAPKLVPRGAQPGRPAGGESPVSGSGNRTVFISSILVLALLAAGLLYKFVLKNPASSAVGNQAVVGTQSASQPAAPASQQAEPDAIPNAQNETGTSATPPQSDANPELGAEGNSAANIAAPAAPPKTPKRGPTKSLGPAYAQAHAAAEQAFNASQYITPPDGSALFWARKAKGLGDPGAAQLETQVFTKLMGDMTAARNAHLYDQAQAQLYQVASNFPERTELKALQDEIHQEQQVYAKQIEEQRRQADLAAQTQKFPVQHRHGTGESFCTGLITITPDGIGHYDCNTADGKGRCEHVTFATDSLKEVKVRGDGSLHLSTRQQGNFDFTGGEFSLKGAAATLGKLVKR